MFKKKYLFIVIFFHNTDFFVSYFYNIACNIINDYSISLQATSFGLSLQVGYIG